jgi:allantoicase
VAVTEAEVRRLPDLASRALGGSVMGTNDDFFADVHSLIANDPPRHDPAEFAARGKVYDGWETRRRRVAGDDHVIIRLGVGGVVRAVDIDTTHFKGNYPSRASVDATTLLGYPSLDEVRAAEWTPLVESVDLAGDSVNLAPAEGPDRLVTHVRLTIHPDGGVARFRVFGEVIPDPRRLGGRVDLAALVHGGRVDDCSNMFYAAPANALAPGRAQVMSDGWETARRRDDGNDWLVVRLAAPGVLDEAVIDTARFVGNAPGWAALTDADTGAVLLPRTRLQPDTEHLLRVAPAPATERVRLDIYPDGGISRLRLRGAVPVEQHAGIAQRWLDRLPAGLSPDPAEFFA